MIKILIFCVVFVVFCHGQKPVNYSNTLINWERRELKCEASLDGQNSGVCVLYKRNETKGSTPTCVFDKTKNRLSCDIDCVGADRDSVISKSPNSNHKCVRYYTYNSHLDESTGKWSMWRANQCLLEKMALEIHCGFP